MEYCGLCRLVATCFLSLCTSTLYVKCSSSDSLKYETNMVQRTHTGAECYVEGQRYICEDIPREVPANITDVEVTEYMENSLSNKFSDSTWKQVTTLHVTANNVRTVIDNTFTGLSLLEVVLVMPNVNEFEEDAFAGLESLEKLDLIDMQFVHTKTVFVSILGAIPKLKHFTFNPGIADHPSLLQLFNVTLSQLFSRSLVSLNFSNTLIQCKMDGSYFDFFRPGVDVLNISGSTIVPISESGLRFRGVNGSQPLFKTLDWSRTVFPILTKTKRGHRKRGDVNKYIDNLMVNKYTLLVENMYSNYLFRQDTAVVDSFDATHVPYFWKSIHYRGNRILYFNCTWTFNLNNTIYLIDLSDNKLEYISPEFCATFIHLTTIILSENRFYLMQFRGEFAEFLKPMKELKFLDLSSNKLSFIPYNMFSTNNRLECLNLAFNELTSVMFALDNLHSLTRLDLQSNHIQTIEGVDLLRLRSYINLKVSAHSHLKFMLQGNTLVCTCESVLFIDWLASLVSMRNSSNAYNCKYEGRWLNVDDTAVGKSKYLCIRNIVITATSLGCAVLFTISLVTVVVLVKRYKKRKATYLEDVFYAQFKQGKLPECYLVFMAYSSHDENIVKDYFKRPFQEMVRACIKTDRDVVATGDDFRPGHNIMEEAYGFIKTSCVFLAVVSTGFVNSKFCMAEIREAGNQKKSIILLFTEDVDQSGMTPYMREIFNKTARAKMLVRENGGVDFVPSLDKICHSAIGLAINRET